MKVLKLVKVEPKVIETVFVELPPGVARPVCPYCQEGMVMTEITFSTGKLLDAYFCGRLGCPLDVDKSLPDDEKTPLL